MVREHRINREAWASVVAELIVSETRGNRAEFARLVGADYKTVGRWLKAEVDVSEESVRNVARATHRPAAELLVKLGYYDAGEVTGTERPMPEPDDKAMQLILTSDEPERVKMQMIARLEELRQRDRDREAEEVAWWLRQRKEGA